MFQANDCPHSGSNRQSRTPAPTTLFSSSHGQRGATSREGMHGLFGLKTLMSHLMHPKSQRPSAREPVRSVHVEVPPVLCLPIETSHQNPVQPLSSFTHAAFAGCGVWNSVETPKVMVKHAGAMDELHPKSIPGLGVAGFDPANQYSVATLDGVKGQLNIILVGGDPARAQPNAEGKRVVVAITEKVGLVSGSVYLTEDGREVELDSVGRLWASPGQIIYQFRPGKPRETQYSDAFYEQTLDESGRVVEDKLTSQHYIHTHHIHSNPASLARELMRDSGDHLEGVLA